MLFRSLPRIPVSPEQTTEDRIRNPCPASHQYCYPVFFQIFTSNFDDEPFRPISTPHSQSQPFLKKSEFRKKAEPKKIKDKKSKNATTSRTVLLPPLSLSSDPQLPHHPPQLPSQLTPYSNRQTKKNTNLNFTSSFSQFILP